MNIKEQVERWVAGFAKCVGIAAVAVFFNACDEPKTNARPELPEQQSSGRQGGSAGSSSRVPSGGPSGDHAPKSRPELLEQQSSGRQGGSAGSPLRVPSGGASGDRASKSRPDYMYSREEVLFEGAKDSLQELCLRLGCSYEEAIGIARTYVESIDEIANEEVYVPTGDGYATGVAMNDETGKLRALGSVEKKILQGREQLNEERSEFLSKRNPKYDVYTR